jgi:Phosphotransferase enzyme family
MESAVRAAVAVAAAHGLPSDDPVVLCAAWHVLVHLRPLPIVARVSSGNPDQPEDDVVRELAVAGHAAQRGAPVIPPTDLLDPGPHRHGGHVVAFWRFVDTVGELDTAAAGRRLRIIHDALEDFDGALPEAHYESLAAILARLPPSDDVELLRVLGSRRVAAPAQAIHGDAHVHNCLQTADGPLWHDFETACRGPRELDLAALVLHDPEEGQAAIAAYGEHDATLLEELLPIYAAWIYASWSGAVTRRPELAPRLRERLRWLRETYA